MSRPFFSVLAVFSAAKHWRVGVAMLLAAGVFSCGWLFWAAQTSSVTAFVLPGATNVVVSPRGFNAARVSYHAAGHALSWRDGIWQQVSAQRWRGRDYTFGVTRQFAVTWYTREVAFGPLHILESAVVGGDPYDANVVNIELHRELRVEGFP